MTIKVGINGFGRIGRFVFRAAVVRDDIEVVGINDLIDVDYMAYMLKYDSTHGRFNGTVKVVDGDLVVNGKTVRVTAERDPAALKWNEINAEVIMKATNVDGIYNKDPKKFDDATKVPSITHHEALSQGLKVIDSTAISLCMDNKMPIVIFKLMQKGNILNVLIGDSVGSIIHS